MKAVVTALILCLSSTFSVASEKFSLDASHTTIAFLIEHIGYARTLGQFSESSGTFGFDPQTRQISDVSIMVQTASVNSGNEARDKHVRNKDFLNVKKFPTMQFTAQSGSIDESGEGILNGELTLLDTTQPLALNIKLNKADNYPFGHKKFTLGISARAELKRSDYGMQYGVANGLVGDIVELIIETEAMQE